MKTESSSSEMPNNLSNGHGNGHSNGHNTSCDFETPQHGAHNSIVLKEWNDLTGHIDNKKAVFIDIQDLSIAKIAAVSR